MKWKFIISKLTGRDDGSAIIEFAIIAPVFFLLFFGITEFGLFMYHKILIERVAVEIARITSIGKSSDDNCSGFTSREAYIVCVVKSKTSMMINGDKVEVQVNTLASGATQTPDICLDNPVPSSAPATCSVFEDVNGSGKYEGVAASNAGNAGEVMKVNISYPFVIQFPIMNKFFGSENHKGIAMISTSTTLKNEPF